MRKDPREGVKRLMAAGDLERLLEKAGEIHGHYCSHVALGVMATYAAFKRLCITDSTGMEGILAIVECNNCFVDGIQAVSGCTIGNNALIYKDLGKTAVTFINRKTKEAVRLAARYPDEEEPADPEAAEARALFDRAVKRREKLPAHEMARMKELWTKMSFAVLSRRDDELFDIKSVAPEEIEYAPIFDTVTCELCGERVMEPRIRRRGRKALCIACADEGYRMVAGRGIRDSGKQ